MIHAQIKLTRWQWQWLEQRCDADRTTIDERIGESLRAAEAKEFRTLRNIPVEIEGNCLWKCVLEPQAAVCLDLDAGQILRVEQTIGGQCADINIIARDQYQTPFSAGHTRNFTGAYPHEGAALLSDLPAGIPLLTLLRDTVDANDILFPRCSAHIYRAFYGLDSHPNCHDIQTALREASGLGGEQVHDTFNLFMATSVQPDGQLVIERNQAQAGDFADLRAETNVTVLIDVCADDLSPVNLWWQSALQLSVWSGKEPVQKVPFLRGKVDSPSDLWETRTCALAPDIHALLEVASQGACTLSVNARAILFTA